MADRIIEVSDADSFAMTRRLAREEALLVGGSCGMATVAALRLAHELDGTPEGEDAVIVVLLPDSGRGYLAKVFNDEWLGQYGFLPATDEQTVGEVLRGKSGRLPDLVHTHPSETIAEAVHILQEYGVSQMPVVRAEPPIVAAEVAGSVSERALLDALFSGHAKLVDAVENHMDAPLPTIGASEPVGEAVALLEKADALLVQEDGKPIGVVTRQDLLAYLATGDLSARRTCSGDRGRPDRVGVQDPGQRLDPVDQPRSGPGERRVGVDGLHRHAGRQTSGRAPARPAAGGLPPEAARRADDHLRPAAATSSQATR